MQEIHYAAARGDLETVQEELRNGADVNHWHPSYSSRRLKKVLGESEYTPLIYAAGDSRADCQMLGLLLDQGADVNIESGAVATTALGNAIRHGQLENAKYLVSRGADIDYITKNGFNAWLDAAYCTSETKPEIFEWLLDFPWLNINQKSRRYGEHICKRLSMFGEFELLDKVLNAGGKRGVLKWTDLMWEIVYGTVESVQMALPKANLKKRDYWGRDAWLLSALVGSIHKSEAIFDFVPDPLTTDRLGCNALHLAATANHMEMLTWLLDLGMDIHSRDMMKDTPLIEASQQGATPAVKLLLELGTDSNGTDFRRVLVNLNRGLYRILY